jgi:hypothetical protein
MIQSLTNEGLRRIVQFKGAGTLSRLVRSIHFLPPEADVIDYVDSNWLVAFNDELVTGMRTVDDGTAEAQQPCLDLAKGRRVTFEPRCDSVTDNVL